jgi:hypothetical protein
LTKTQEHCYGNNNENFQPPRSDNKNRFKTVSEEELRELQERKQSTK